ncbi:MAG: ArnT family glycosyltransferase [Thermoanaerobaculia bacterium]
MSADPASTSEALPARGELRELLLLAIVALVLFGAGIGLRNPWPADEPRFALIARDMVASGQWFFPEVGEELYADKPPVFFWMIAALYALTGSLRFSFLFPSLVAAGVTLALVYDLGKRFWGHRAGLFAAATLVATAQFALQARAAQIDMTLCMFTTLGIYGLARHLIGGPRWGWYAIGFAAMGAGTITKGVGFLPALALIPWGWAAWKGWPEATRSRSWKWLIGPVALLAVVGLWLVPMLWLVESSGDPAYAAYRDEILFKQTGERYASSWHHVKPPWYFVVNVIPALWLPFSIAIPWLVPRWRARLRERDTKILLLLGWALCVLLFFSISPGKRGVYILPALPAVALAAAPWIREMWDRRGVNRIGFAIALVAAVALGGGLLFARFVSPDRAASLAATFDVEFPWGPLILLTVVSIALIVSFWVRRGIAALSLLIASVWVVLGFWIAPKIDPVRSGEMLIGEMEQRLAPGDEVGMIAWKEQFLLHVSRPVTVFGHRRFDEEQELLDGAAWLVRGKSRRLFLDEAGRDRCFGERGTFVAHAHRENWYLVEADDLDRACYGRGHGEVARAYKPGAAPR